MGERLVDGDFKVMSSSTTDLLQKLNQSIKSVEQEIRVQKAVVHMSNLKVKYDHKAKVGWNIFIRYYDIY